MLAAIRAGGELPQRDPDKQPKMLGFFVGQIMKKSQGKANRSRSSIAAANC